MITLEEIWDNIQILYSETPTVIIYILLFLGLSIIFKALYNIFYVFIWNYFLRPSPNLLKKYGNCWALITGASEGIGEAMAYQIAAKGLNVILIARREHLLKGICLKIREKYKVEAEYLVFDFDVDIINESIYDPIVNLSRKYDIGVLVNNVGIFNWCRYSEQPLPNIQKMINVNVRTTAFLTRAFLPHLLSRSHHSLVVFLSSMAADIKAPYSVLYNGTKSFITGFAHAIKIEMRDRLDVCCISPGGVNTSMHPTQLKFFMFDIGNANVAAKQYISKFGGVLLTSGHWKSLFQTISASYVPSKILYHYMKYLTKKYQKLNS